MAIAIAISVLPVFAFLGALVFLDSYKLIPLRAILLAVAAGAAAGVVGYAVNVSLQPALALDPARYSRYVAPLLEELLKALYIIWLLYRSRIGFVVDGVNITAHRRVERADKTETGDHATLPSGLRRDDSRRIRRRPDVLVRPGERRALRVTA